MQLKKYKGFATLEAVVALALVMGSGLSLLWLFQQALSQQQHLVQQSRAQRLAVDLVERILINPTQMSVYATPWRTHLTQAPSDCTQIACAPTELALWDQAQWWQALRNDLPHAQAQLQSIDPQLDIWRLSLAWQAPPDVLDERPCPSAMRCLHIEFTPLL